MKNIFSSSLALAFEPRGLNWGTNISWRMRAVRQVCLPSNNDLMQSLCFSKSKKFKADKPFFNSSNSPLQENMTWCKVMLEMITSLSLSVSDDAGWQTPQSKRNSNSSLCNSSSVLLVLTYRQEEHVYIYRSKILHCNIYLENLYYGIISIYA